MSRLRLAAALLVPPPVDREIEGLRRALGDRHRSRLAPHLTLVPPVNVREDELPVARSVLAEAATAAAVLTLGLGPVATFHPVSPVLYLRVDGPDEVLDRLAQLRSSLFRPPLEREVSHEFVPHVTVASEAGPDRIESAVRSLADYRTEVTFDRVHLLTETRTDSGARRWVPWSEAPLAEPAVIGRGGLELAVDVVESLPAEALLSESLATPGGQVGERGLVVTGRRHGGVVGLLRGRSRGPVALVDELVVEPAHRRTGVAHHLLAAFESEARARGCRWLEALVPAGHPASRALFDRRGWVSEAGRPTGELIRVVREVPGGAPTSGGPAGAGQ